MLDSSTQVLENQLFLTISGSKTMFLFDHNEMACNEAELLQLIKQTCKITNRHQYNLNGAILNEAYLLSLLDDASSIASTEKSLADRNNTIYRQLCSLVRDLGERVIVIKHAQKLKKPAVQLLSRLARYAKKSGSNWKFFLLTDGTALDPISLRLLSIEQIFPDSAQWSPNKTPSASSSHKAPELDLNEKKSPAKNTWLKTGSVIFMALMVGLALWSIFQSPVPESSSMNELNQASVEQTSHPLASAGSQVAILSRGPSIPYLSDTEFQQELANITRVASGAIDEDSLATIVKEESTLDGVAGEVRPVVDKQQMSKALSRALQSSNVAKVASLVLEGESLESINERGETALIYAINSNDSHLLNSLLAMKADVDFVDDYGRSALFYACIEGRSSTIKALLDAGADANLKSLQWKTPLMAATHNGNEGAASILIQNGAEVDAQDKSGWTALFHAAWNDNLEMSRFLVSRGSKPDIVDANGYTAAQIAEFRGSGNVFAYLNSLTTENGATGG